jgi:4-hydroxy-tetrahydrodipicolinate reductase
MDLVVVGAAGRMGRQLVGMIAASEGRARLVGAVEPAHSRFLGADAGEVAGLKALGVTITTDPLPLFAKAEGVLDFTTPAASLFHAGLCAQARIAHVCGTTGFGPEDEAKFRAAARHAPIVKSGNMSLGINLLLALVRQAAAALPGFDAEIVEMHHRAKVDAPSGTALLLGEAVAAGRGVTLGDVAVRSRDGHTGARPDGAIGFATLRGGAVVGEHTVMFAGDAERIEITHKAQDRALFAQGALAAALWAKGRKPGLYSMADVLGLST